MIRQRVDMNQELIDAMKKRKQKLGVDDGPQEPEKVQPVKPTIVHGENFNQNKKMLEELYNKKSQPVVLDKKEQFKGDQQNFKNARAQLEKQFGKGPANNGLNINTVGSPGTLPPPPPSLNNNFPLLPPPPLPPSFDMLPPLPIPSLNLLPPALNLPPPPLILPTPPPLNLPPPPPSNISQPKTSFNPPPPINLPPPPPPPPSKQNDFPPPPPSKYTNNNNSYKPAPINISNQSKKNPPLNKPYDDEPCFILSGGSGDNQESSKTQTNPKVPQVTAWNDDQLEKSKKKRIFDKKSQKKYPITEDFFGKNLGAFVKQEFLRTVNILSVIDKQVKKQVYEFHFPSIENKIRNIEPIETLYADTDILDLVSCFMTKNLNAAKIHNDQRDQFVNQLHNYNWEADTLKLKPIRESAAQIPNCHYIEPNFVQIKNGFKRIDNLINNLAQQQEFAKCNQLKGLRVQTEKMLLAYLSHPTSNANLIEQIDSNVAQMKNLQV